MTKSVPSKASRNDASAPSRVDPNIRRAARPTMRIAQRADQGDGEPATRTTSLPKTSSPTAIIHLPTRWVDDEVALGSEDVGGAVCEQRVGRLQRRQVRISTP